jgi:hypothetical protein|tara:strand:+ start:466 stop:702 length:237 start_codon:yes stop_codon:yes gene_type:complete
MNIFRKNKKYQLITKHTWGDTETSELVLEGTEAELKAYAKKSFFTWEIDDTKPRGGHYTRSIDGYRTHILDIVEKQTN